MTKTMGWDFVDPRFAYNLRPELKLGKSVSQSAARIQMMSQPCETVPCSLDFHERLLAPVIFYSYCNPYTLFSPMRCQQPKCHHELDGKVVDISKCLKMIGSGMVQKLFEYFEISVLLPQETHWYLGIVNSLNPYERERRR